MLLVGIKQHQRYGASKNVIRKGGNILGKNIIAINLLDIETVPPLLLINHTP